MNEQNLKQLFLEQRTYFEALLPKKVSISFICDRKDISRQGVRQRLINNYEPDVDFWKEGKKIYMHTKIALEILNFNQMI